MREGATQTGNPTPVAIDLQDASCAGEDDPSDSVFLSELDPYGAVVKTYAWINYGGESGDEECWADTDTFEKAEGVTIDPGAGLWIEGVSENQSVTFPGVEL